MNKKFKISKLLEDRPLSWSAISSFEYDPKQWHDKYVLGIKQDASAEMLFGKTFADSCEARKPLAPVTLLKHMEYEFSFEFNNIPMIGFADTYDFDTIGEYKTGVKPWDQKRVDNHGQLDMYALGNFIMHKVKPEDCEFFLEWIPTKRKGDYSIGFVKRNVVHHFDTKRTTMDILKFGTRIKDTVKKMEDYARNI